VPVQAPGETLLEVERGRLRRRIARSERDARDDTVDDAAGRRIVERPDDEEPVAVGAELELWMYSVKELAVPTNAVAASPALVPSPNRFRGGTRARE